MSRLNEICMTRPTFNVVLVGVAFLLMFTAFQSCGFIQQTVIDSSTNYTDIDNHAGYYSLSIIYATLTVGNLVAAPIVNILGPRLSMMIGAIGYALFLGSFLYLRTWFLYLTSAILGFGGSILWTGNGNYITLNSKHDTMARNSGIFWAILQSSLLWGSIFLYFEFEGKDTIDKDTVKTVYISFTCLCCAGILVMFLFGKPQKHEEEEKYDKPHLSNFDEFRKSFLSTFLMLTDKDMLLALIVFIYTGLILAFWSGVYGTSLANTNRFGTDKNSLLGINGILIGISEIIGGVTFGIFGKKTIKYSRKPIVILGLAVHLIAFVIIFINIPDQSPISATDEKAYIDPIMGLAIFCSFLLGFGDSCFNTQVYSLLGSLFRDRSAPAFALFKFFQSICAAIGFFYSSVLVLKWQLLILLITSILGTLAFVLIENRSIKRSADKEEKEDLASDKLSDSVKF